MSITRQPPRTVLLGGQGVHVNDIKASTSITPGMLLKLFNNSGTANYEPHGTSDGTAQPVFALSQPEMNRSVDDAYNAGDVVEAFVPYPGATIWALIGSGVSVNPGDFLSSKGDGTLHAGSAGFIAQAKEAITAANTGFTRLRVEILN